VGDLKRAFACKGAAVERVPARQARLGVTTNEIASRARSTCLQPASCNRSANHLVSMQMPYRDLANVLRSARERYGQNDIMQGVRCYDLS
jgi:hypothetical protein